MIIQKLHKKPPLRQQERFHIDVTRKPEDCGIHHPNQVDYTIILHILRGLFFIPFFRSDTMSKRKKYPKLPNGYGSIKRLSGKNRTNPYGVYPPVKEFDENGIPVPQKAICYVDD